MRFLEFVAVTSDRINESEVVKLHANTAAANLSLFHFDQSIEIMD